MLSPHRKREDTSTWNPQHLTSRVLVAFTESELGYAQCLGDFIATIVCLNASIRGTKMRVDDNCD